MENREFVIPLNGLASGRNEFRWKADKEFFGSFGNTEVLDADLTAEVVAFRQGRRVDLECRIAGNLTVICDRCMEELLLPIDTEVQLCLRPEGDRDAESEDEEVETVYYPLTDKEMDLSQIIYDYSCLALPMQRFHEEGGCNPVVIERLQSGITIQGTDTQANPFSALSGLFPEDGGKES